ncbi:aminomethyltransferase [Streptoalloteichus tenebrarius]|uniref:Aminomethyltransferase n=1 Tax=Streptoalloteichus tenebrarius (strain ATCC 17920 / DSM 40477 / JCM 4838 / CBS 697.72 / NBRC 16177 / NCIMB 11028 / NRRL B-12390 / A12253. 1 / ISP 5477) TaxID=1933 RepID=A0ABT1I0Z8_STRSD|nr:glycine cleavage system aminomethyltransferase GcvT [Streptoalloteichus tenebrarius]MCP2261439.1 aminomethyltransferase [Streptoalloteichus tenebrarius]BFE99675.1 glycine cleavage system aminomethyltransferase GcvT [Streptoalloteichus tenebrarius]
MSHQDTSHQDRSRPTPLHAVHVALGASMTDFAGWTMPLRYTSELAEHHAVRNAAGLFDLSHMGEIVLTGPGSAAALDHALVGNIGKLAVHRARYTMICDTDGGVLDDLIVYRTGQQEYLVVANAANTAVVLAALTERVAGFDTELRDATEDQALLAVQGPRAVDLLTPLTDADLGALKYYASVPTTVSGHPVLLARTGYTGEDGFELFCAPDDAEPLWNALRAAGGPQVPLPAGLACRDSLRLEAGMPLYGNELTRERTPFEAGLGRVVKFDKGDFVGRDALLARAEAGPRETLVGLVGRGRRAPRAGYPVVDPATGAPLGVVTSGAPSPTLGKPVAMAYVPVDRAEPGTELAVDVRGRQEPVDVVPLPFYRRES